MVDKTKTTRGLYVTYFYLPILVPRSIVAFKHLENSSIDFDVFCSMANRVEKDNSLKHKRDIKIISKVHTSGLFSKMRWIVKAFQYYWSRRNYYDFIMTSYMPIYSLMPGLLSKLLSPKITWVSYYSDPPGLNLGNSVSLSKKIFAFVERFFVKLSYSKADLLIFTNQDQLEASLSSGKYINKAFVLKHSYDKSLYPDKCKINKDRVVFSHFGRLFGKRNALSLLQAISEIKNEHASLYNKLVLNFYGLLSEEQVEFINQNHLDCVHISDFVDYRTSLQKMKEGNVLLCIDATLPDGQNIFYPSKLADYIGAGKQILSITPGDSTTRKITMEVGGYSVDNDVQKIKKLVIDILKNGTKLRINKNGLKYDATFVSHIMDQKIQNSIISRENAKKVI